MRGLRSIIVVAVVAVVAFGANAHADNAKAARALFKKGIDEYKAKKFGEASMTLLKAYELDPRPDTLFALAQAERFDGRCADAIEHYKKLLEQTTDLPTAKAVQTNVELCEPPKPADPKPVDPKPVDPNSVDLKRDDTKVSVVTTPGPATTKIVTRTEQRLDIIATSLFVGGAVAIGGSVGLYLKANASDSDSKNATVLAESNRLYDRSKTERLAAYVTAGVGVALVATGVFKVMRTRSKRVEVAAVPTSGGATLWVTTGW